MNYDFFVFEPLVKYLPKKLIQKTDNYLIMAQINKDLTEYLCRTLAYSLFVCTFAFWFFLFFTDIFVSFILAIIFLFSSFVGFIYHTKMKAIKISQEAERDLPIALRALAVELNVDIPFEQALKNLTKGGYGQASEIFSLVLRDVEFGNSIPKALQRISKKYYSQNVKRMLAHLSNAYRLTQ